MTHEDELCLLLARGRAYPRNYGTACSGTVGGVAALDGRWMLERTVIRFIRCCIAICSRSRISHVPEQVLAELKGAYVSNALRNQLFAEELARLLRLLGDAAIPVIPLKGVTLSQALYGDPGSSSLRGHRHSRPRRRCGNGAAHHSGESIHQRVHGAVLRQAPTPWNFRGAIGFQNRCAYPLWSNFTGRSCTAPPRIMRPRR